MTVLAVARKDANEVELQYCKHVINNDVESTKDRRRVSILTPSVLNTQCHRVALECSVEAHGKGILSI